MSTGPICRNWDYASFHDAREFQRPILDDDNRKIIAVLDHQKSAIGTNILALVSHQVESVRAIE